MKKIGTALRGLVRADLEAVFAYAHSLQNPHRVLVVSLGLAAVFGLGVVDALSSPYVGFALFYAMTIMGVTFHGGWVAGTIVAIMASGASLTSNLLYAPDEVSSVAALWDLGNEIAVFVSLVLIVHQLRTMFDKLADQSSRDLLTGALNTRGILEAFERERSRAQRNASPLSLAFIDLDNMKRVNDELGHAEGDEMLRILATGVLSAIREADVFGRVGGDEFALILPDTDEQAAVKAIQRLRSVVNRRTHARSPYISVSVGVVTFRRDPPDASDALRAADSLMYVAKRAGGNRVAGRVLAWDSEPLGEFGLVFDLAEPLPSWQVGDEDYGSATA
ncbi:MAG: GGDEF domain-containing protein [Acidimicrobiia bacterium]|nr:GGDEF domain-containing protein [Acidimicrobiia bacterium]